MPNINNNTKRKITLNLEMMKALKTNPISAKAANLKIQTKLTTH